MTLSEAAQRLTQAVGYPVTLGYLSVLEYRGTVAYHWISAFATAYKVSIEVAADAARPSNSPASVKRTVPEICHVG